MLLPPGFPTYEAMQRVWTETKTHIRINKESSSKKVLDWKPSLAPGLGVWFIYRYSEMRWVTCADGYIRHQRVYLEAEHFSQYPQWLIKSENNVRLAKGHWQVDVCESHKKKKEVG